MLNPSDAGEEKDEPTARKIMGFGRRWGYGRIVAVNLIPIVSSDPWELPPWSGIDPENRKMLEYWLSIADLVVAAWGSQPKALMRTIALSEHVYNFVRIEPRKIPLHCIGTTKEGYPKHPSRAPYTSAPEVWSSDPLYVGAEF